MSKPVLIGDFLHRIRRPINLDPTSRYKLVTVKLYHKGVVLREEKLGAEIKSKMYQVQEGDFVLSGIDARNGAFGIVPPELDGAIVTNDFWYFDIDADLVDKSFFLELTATHWFDEICRKGSDGTTQRIRLQKDKFFNQIVYLPDLKEQRLFNKRFQASKAIHKKLTSEIIHQKNLLKKIRQQIFQEAIEGKLTADWRAQNPNVEPASELIKRIVSERERLVKEKIIKVQGFRPAIIEAEKLFELPDGWAWTQLGNLAQVLGGKRVPHGHVLVESETDHKYARVLNLTNGTVEGSFKYLTTDTWKKISNYTISKDDLYITIAGTIGRCGIVPDELDGINLTENSSKLCFYLKLCTLRKFVFLTVQSQLVQSQFVTKVYGMAVPKLALKRIQSTFIPLPPLMEQLAIVTKVEKLLALCDQLETQIAQNQTHAEQLIQAVLKEAFSHNSAATPSVIPGVTSNTPESANV